jgi:carbon-monoxide dehydrogenase large subunit
MENLIASAHARETAVAVRAAVAADGVVLALEVEIVEDFGAYCFYPANYIARVVAMILTGPYRIRDYAYDVKVALTNKCGAAPMRAPMAIASWVIEGTMDAIARALGLDRAAVRRRNMISRAELPYQMPAGPVLEDVTPRETLEAALEGIDYDGFPRRQAAARAEGRHLGLGICTVLESTTYGSAFYKAAGIPGSGHEAAWVRVEPTGAINASAGIMSSGQGYETVFAQAVAEGLGVDPGDVEIHLGNTAVAPYGMGSRGARGATAAGGVLYLAARAARAKALAIAANRLGLNVPESLRLRGGVVERETGGAWQATELTLAALARAAYLDPLSLPEGMEPGFEIHRAYDPPPLTFSNATHVCEVELDPATGEVRILRYLVAEDCGTVLNPQLAAGQQQGAIAMGIGGALYENIAFDGRGQILSATLADYLLPTACEVPGIELLPMHTANRRTPAGIKGMAEGGVMGATGAVGNAVNDALAPFGVVASAQPFSPDRLRALLRTAPTSSPG